MAEKTTEELVSTLEAVCEDGNDETKAAIVELATVRLEEIAHRIWNIAGRLEVV